MAGKLEDQEILDKTINSDVGTSDVNQHRIEEILDEVICKVVDDKRRGASQDLKTEAEHRSQVKKEEVLTYSHRGQVLFHPCNLIEYQVPHTFQIFDL